MCMRLCVYVFVCPYVCVTLLLVVLILMPSIAVPSLSSIAFFSILHVAVSGTCTSITRPPYVCIQPTFHRMYTKHKSSFHRDTYCISLRPSALLWCVSLSPTLSLALSRFVSKSRCLAVSLSCYRSVSLSLCLLLSLFGYLCLALFLACSLSHSSKCTSITTPLPCLTKHIKSWCKTHLIWCVMCAKCTNRISPRPSALLWSLCLSIFLSRPFSGSVLLSCCLAVCLSLCLSVSLSLVASLCLSLSLSVSVCLSLTLSISLCLPLSLSLSLCLSVSQSLSLSVSFSFSLSLAFSLQQKIVPTCRFCPLPVPWDSTRPPQHGASSCLCKPSHSLSSLYFCV